MKISISKMLLVMIVLAVAILMGPGRNAKVAAESAQQTNLLQNPSFEEPYKGGIAGNWGAWHQELNSNPKPADCSEKYMVQPKWNGELASGGLIKDGARSQQVGNSFDTWRGGVLQTVNVNPGSTYRFTFYATGRASNEQYPAPSDASVNLGIRAGIDPNGSGLWSDGDIVWGATGSPHMSGSSGNWQEFSVEATATGSQVTVFVQSDNSGPQQCRKHLDAWFDQSQLIEIGPPPTNTPPPPPPPPPQPVVTNTPIPPTLTATSEIPPTATLVPTDTPTNTPVPPEGGIICTNAFADDNANGQRDADEGYMAGVTFSVANGNAVIAQGVSVGSDTPICFEELDAGTYTVGQQVPRNLEMTTAATATVDLTAGSIISLEFGSRVKSDDGDEISSLTPTEEGSAGTDDGSSSGEGVSLLAIFGLAAIGIAVVLLVVLIILLFRQQRS